MTRRQLPSEHELRAMVGQGLRDMKDLKAAVRGALVNGTATGALRDQIAELRGRVADWGAAIEEIAAREARVITDRIAALRLDIGVAAAGRVADLLAGLQPPPYPSAQIEGMPS